MTNNSSGWRRDCFGMHEAWFSNSERVSAQVLLLPLSLIQTESGCVLSLCILQLPVQLCTNKSDLYCRSALNLQLRHMQVTSSQVHGTFPFSLPRTPSAVYATQTPFFTWFWSMVVNHGRQNRSATGDPSSCRNTLNINWFDTIRPTTFLYASGPSIIGTQEITYAWRLCHRPWSLTDYYDEVCS